MSTIWERVQALNGKTIQTLARQKEFEIIGVLQDRIEFRPKAGKGTARWAGRDQIEHVAGLDLERSQLTTTRLAEEYPDDQNLSYIAAIVHTVTIGG